MKKIIEKNLKYIGSAAMTIAKISANSTSLWYNYQPQTPKELKK